MQKHALVVDDSNFFLKLISDILATAGFAATTCFDGASACQELESKQFDLVVTDLNMPEMDGIEFVNRVKRISNGRSLPVVMISSEKDEERIRMARQSGVARFLSKPLNKQQFVGTLAQLFKKNEHNGPPPAIFNNARFFKQGDKEIFVLNFATDSQKEIVQLIDLSADQIRKRPPKSVRALTIVQKGMFSNDILQKLKTLARDNEPYIDKSAVVGVNGVYKVAMDAVTAFSKRKFKFCNSKEEAVKYLLQ